MNKEHFEINPHNLHVEWAEHSAMYYSCEVELLEAQKEKDNAKDYLEEMKSKLALSVRENPQKYKIVKVTEGVITETVQTQPEYLKALKDLRDSNHKLEKMKLEIRSLNTKKGCMEYMCTLFGMQYWSSPNIERVFKKGGKVGFSEVDFSERVKENVSEPVQRRRRNSTK